jgi:hypothetical protein
MTTESNIYQEPPLENASLFSSLLLAIPVSILLWALILKLIL